jgi:hypothetical protein
MRRLFRSIFIPCLSQLFFIARLTIGQTEVAPRVEVEAEPLPSAYGAPPDLSRGRISTLTKSYVLPPFGFELETIYEGDIFRGGPPRHLFTQEVEVGWPLRFDVAIQNEVRRFSGSTDDRSFSITGRYALADWNKIALNPTVFGEYKAGFGAISDAVEFGLIMSRDFRHMIEWAMNWFVEQEVNGERSTNWGFAQSVEVPVLLPEERLEVGLEMQYLQKEKSIAQVAQPRGLVIGPTLAWRPTKTARFDLSPLFGCTGDSPRVEIFAVFSLSLGKATTGETETPISGRTR